MWPGMLVLAGCCATMVQAAILNIDSRVVSKNVSSTLDTLLDKRRYDKRIRPDYGGQPVTITVNLLVKTMGSVTETDESYTMDIYFRQVWYDSRLQFSPLPGRGQLSLPWLFMGLVWKPDTFFMNGKRSHLHRITAPNTFLRLRHDGYITYSMRLTVKARCPMHLRKFPLDSQRCPLLISSYGYRTDDVLYRWNSSSSVENVDIEPNLEIAQFDLVNVTTEDQQFVMRGHSGRDEYSMIKAVFHLKRHTGFFMLQTYVPCVLIVCCSWVSFWIDPQDAPGRVILGVMNALSLTTLGVGGKAQMPKVSYPTAIDWFVILCNFFVFAVMVEYAAVNLSDKITKDLKKLIQDRLGSKTTPPKNGQGLDVNLSSEPQRSVSMVNLPLPGSTLEDTAQLSISAVELSPAREQDDHQHSGVQREDPLQRDQDQTEEEHLPTSSHMAQESAQLGIGTEELSSAGQLGQHQYGKIRRSDDSPPKDVEQEAEVVSPIIRVSGEMQDGCPDKPLPPVPPHGPRVIPRIKISRGPSCDNGQEEHTYDEIHGEAERDEGISLEEEEDGRSTAGIGSFPQLDEDLHRSDTLRVFSRSARRSVRRSLMRPVRAWRSYRFLPCEEDVSRQLESQEEPSKFSAMDINSRKVFPITFLLFQAAYWFAYLYYITDELPSKETSKTK